MLPLWSTIHDMLSNYMQDRFYSDDYIDVCTNCDSSFVYYLIGMRIYLFQKFVVIFKNLNNLNF